MKKTITTLVDDIDGGDAAEEMVFAFDGGVYQIDLSEDNAAAFRAAMEPFVAAAKKLGRRAAPAVLTGSVSAAEAVRTAEPGKTPGRVERKNELAAVRSWAASNGFDVAPRGVIKAEVVQAYQHRNDNTAVTEVALPDPEPDPEPEAANVVVILPPAGATKKAVRAVAARKAAKTTTTASKAASDVLKAPAAPTKRAPRKATTPTAS